MRTVPNPKRLPPPDLLERVKRAARAHHRAERKSQETYTELRAAILAAIQAGGSYGAIAEAARMKRASVQTLWNRSGTQRKTRSKGRTQ